jgi:hypothetical protein
VFFSLIAGIYSLVVITINSEKKTNENLKIHALSLSTENDPEAEHLLLDMWPVMLADTLLANMMEVEFFERSDFNLISAYLNDKYFNEYWGNFNVNIYLCRQGQMIRWDREKIIFRTVIPSLRKELSGTDIHSPGQSSFH